jgi:hypothetical protein
MISGTGVANFHRNKSKILDQTPHLLFCCIDDVHNILFMPVINSAT